MSDLSSSVRMSARAARRLSQLIRMAAAARKAGRRFIGESVTAPYDAVGAQLFDLAGGA